MKNPKCILCGRALRAFRNGFLRHPDASNHPDGCLVQYTDAYGVSVELEDIEVLEATTIEPEETGFEIDLQVQIYPHVDEVLEKFFASYKMPRMGGASSGKGWSSFSTFQKCPYLWKRRYVDPPAKQPAGFRLERPAMAIGTIIHALLAVYYTRMIKPDFPFTPENLIDALKREANPKLVDEGWRVFCAYAVYYQHDVIQPLAIEYDLRDPRTHESCRYDLVAFFPEAVDFRPAGTYVIEHKSSSRFDQAAMSWQNDGECLGEVALWKLLGLDKRFGPLKGLIVNLIGKQPKEPQFQRIVIAPESWLIEQHLRDLGYWDGLIQLSKRTNIFPRSRSNCIHRYGLCDLYEDCSTEND